jgi:ATP phosphoribosyltransferase regulatory subunit
MGLITNDTVETLQRLFEQAGAIRVEPPLLQPADLFLDISGEEIRTKMFLTTEADGTALCLRPEYTIPICRMHVARPDQDVSTPSSYAYFGSVFRQRPAEPSETLQAGLELLGRDDFEAADAEILSFAVDALQSLQPHDLQIRLGDRAVLDAVLHALDIPVVIQRRITRHVVQGTLDTFLNPHDEAEQSDASPLRMEWDSHHAAQEFVRDVLKLSGTSPSQMTLGGRSVSDIAERFVQRRGNRLSDEQRIMLQHFFTLRGDPDTFAADFEGFVDSAGLRDALDPMIDALHTRNGFMLARDIDLESVDMDSRFARKIDYYTGLMFDIRAAGSAAILASGGRYDTLCSRLQAVEVPAVGCAIWLDRLDNDA